jgi:hypothetical protein
VSDADDVEVEVDIDVEIEVDVGSDTAISSTHKQRCRPMPRAT